MMRTTAKKNEVRSKLLVAALLFMFIVFFVSIFSICSTTVFALGISPGKVVIVYNESELDHDFTFRAVSRDAPVSDLSLFVVAQGDLAQAISFEPMTVDGIFKGHITLPSELSPGEHVQMIILSERAGSDSTVTGSVAVAGQLVIKVPYPEQYLTGTMGATTDVSTGDTQITIVLENLGTVPVNPDDVELRIQDFGQTKESIHVSSEIIQSLSFSKLTINYQGARNGNIVPGEYAGVVRVPYANRELLLQQPIVVGRPVVKILDVKYIPEQGIIQPVDIVGTLSWNRPIQAKLYIYYDDNQIPALTQNVVLQQTFNQRVYLKTVEVGIPNSSIRVEFVAGSAQDTMAISLPAQTTQSSKSMLWLLLLLFVVLVVFAMLVFKFVRGRNGPILDK